MKKIKESDALLQKILIFSIIIVINLLSVYMFFRIDLTKGKAYSISKETKSTLKSLKDDVDIKLFFSKDLPAQLNAPKTYIRDILSEYQTYSHGKLHFEFISTSDRDKFVKDAKNNKIPALPVQVMEKDKMELREVYMGLVINYQDREEVIPVIQTTEGLEYRLTTTIQKLINPVRKKIAYFTPISFEESQKQGENLPGSPELVSLNKVLYSNYLTDRTDLFFPLPPETDLLIVSSVRDSLHPVQLYNLDQFLMTGKPVIIMQDRYWADINEPEAIYVKSNIFDFLMHNGMILKPNLILDEVCYQISTYKQQGENMVPMSFDYPFFPMIQNFNKDLIITKNLDVVQTLFPSEIVKKTKSNVKMTPLLMTSESSSEIAGKTINIYYTQFLGKNGTMGYSMPSKIVAALYEGPFTSFYQNKSMRSENYLDSTPVGKVLLVGTNSVAENELIKNVRGNAEFMINAIDYLTGQSNMIEMRSRNIHLSGFKKTSDEVRQVIKVANFVLPVLAILLTGLIVFIKRKRKQKMIMDLFGNLEERDKKKDE